MRFENFQLENNDNNWCDYEYRQVDGIDSIYLDNKLILIHVPATKLNVSISEELDNGTFRERYCSECPYFEYNILEPEVSDYFCGDERTIMDLLMIDRELDNPDWLEELMKDNPFLNEYFSSNMKNWVAAYRDYKEQNKSSCSGGIYNYNNFCKLAEDGELSEGLDYDKDYLTIDVLPHIIIKDYDYRAVRVFYQDNDGLYRPYYLPNNDGYLGTICLGIDTKFNDIDTPTELFDAVWSTNFDSYSRMEDIYDLKQYLFDSGNREIINERVNTLNNNNSEEVTFTFDELLIKFQ